MYFSTAEGERQTHGHLPGTRAAGGAQYMPLLTALSHQNEPLLDHQRRLQETLEQDHSMQQQDHWSKTGGVMTLAGERREKDLLGRGGKKGLSML